jgi:hypothetical protein
VLWLGAFQIDDGKDDEISNSHQLVRFNGAYRSIEDPVGGIAKEKIDDVFSEEDATTLPEPGTVRGDRLSKWSHHFPSYAVN